MKNTPHRRMAGLAAFLLALTGSTALATPPGSLAVTPADSGEYGNGGTIGGWGWAGNGESFQFEVSAPTQVPALAYYQFPGVPLQRSVEVAIVRLEDHQTVASAVIGPSCPIDHVSTNIDFLFTEISPATLQPGHHYQVVTTFVSVDNLPNSFSYLTAYLTGAPNILLPDSGYFGGNFYVVESVFGDLDGDGIVDGADVGLLLLDFGPCEGCPSDLDGDGTVDGADVGLMLLSFS